MTWTVAQIHRRLVQLDESDRIEAKAGLGDAAMKSVSAFSNEVGLRGGWIVFGVERLEDGSYLTKGVPHPDRLQTELASQCRGVFNRVVDVSIQVDEVDGKRLVVAFVPEAAPGDKPIYIKKMGLPKGAFRRVGSADCVLTDADLVRLASLAHGTPFDRRPAHGARRSDLDPAAIEAYRQQLRGSRPGSELLLMGDDELLEAVGAMGEGEPTHAGLLLFGTRAALRRLMPSLRVDVLIARGPTLGESYDAVEVREALVTGWQRIFQAVSDTMPRRVTLRDDSPRREETARVPDLALREAIVNALVHRDLEVGSAIQIRRFSDRVEINNPGYSLAVEADWEHNRSIARNSTIAQVFTELGLAETRGTGMRRMRTRMAAAGLAPPELVSDREANWFRLTLKFHHLLDEADWTWLERFRGLDDGDRQVLVFALQKPVRNEDVRTLTGDEVSAASQRLARLRDAGLIEQHGTSKADTWYTLSPAARPSNLDGQSSNLESGLSHPEEPSSQWSAPVVRQGAPTFQPQRRTFHLSTAIIATSAPNLPTSSGCTSRPTCGARSMA
jgi:ATP-dependent DNA helicase RecG